MDGSGGFHSMYGYVFYAYAKKRCLLWPEDGIGFCPKMILATDTNLIDVFEGLPIPPIEIWIAAHESIYKIATVKVMWDHLTRAIVPLLS
jgi:DNA-binding transcriptional LysR family regulator